MRKRTSPNDCKRRALGVSVQQEDNYLDGGPSDLAFFEGSNDVCFMGNPNVKPQRQRTDYAKRSDSVPGDEGIVPSAT